MSYLVEAGIRHVVTTCSEPPPPLHLFPDLNWIEIPIKDLEAPTQEQIKIFICFAEAARQMNATVGIHELVGSGTAGTLAACHLIRFYGLSGEMAIAVIRKFRPYDIKTLEQKKAVQDYYEYLCAYPPTDVSWQPGINN